MTRDQVWAVERLRQAAKEHGEVANLLAHLASSFPHIGSGDSGFHGEPINLEYLKTVLIAAAFVEADGELL